MRVVLVLLILLLAPRAADADWLSRLRFGPHPAPTVQPQPVEPEPVAEPEKVEKAKRPAHRVKKKSHKAAPLPRSRPAVIDEGPDLPYPCWLVRFHARGKTEAQLEAEGRANNISLSPKQRRQARACLGRK